MKQPWTAQIHLLTPPTDFGDTRCCTNVVAWAEDEEDFVASITSILARRHWTILSVLHAMPATALKKMIAELEDQVEEARLKPGSCIFGTLHYYPSKPA
jgi:hypothetical protein